MRSLFQTAAIRSHWLLCTHILPGNILLKRTRQSLLAIISVLILGSALAATPDPAQELQRQEQRERELRKQQEPAPDVRLPREALPVASERIPESEAPCFPITRITLTGDAADRFQFALHAVTSGDNPAIGRCLGVQGTRGVIQSNGALNLTAASATLDSGTTTAKRISIDSATISNRRGQIIQTSTDATSIRATTRLDNTSGILASNGNTTLTLGDLINLGGTIQATGTSNLSVNASGAIDNRMLNTVAGNLQAGGAASFTAVSLANTQGQITAGSTLDVTTTDAVNGINNTQGRIAADRGVTLQSGAAIANTSAHIESASGDVNLTAAGAITNADGFVTANQNTQITAASLDNHNGQISGYDTRVPIRASKAITSASSPTRSTITQVPPSTTLAADVSTAITSRFPRPR